jgi:hypothetical protein
MKAKEIKATQRHVRLMGFRVDGTPTGLPEKSTVQCVADVAGSLNDTFFVLNSALDETVYHVWLNVNSAGTYAPSGGETPVEVAVATGASADTVAAAVSAAIDALADFSASVVTDTVTITNAADGETADVADGSAATGFTFAVTQDGVTADISLPEGSLEATIADGANEGEYTITLNEPFARTPVVAIGILTAECIAKIHSVSTSQIVVKCFGVDGTTAKDADFHLIVSGFDCEYQV